MLPPCWQIPYQAYIASSLLSDRCCLNRFYPFILDVLDVLWCQYFVVYFLNSTHIHKKVPADVTKCKRREKSNASCTHWYPMATKSKYREKFNTPHVSVHTGLPWQFDLWSTNHNIVTVYFCPGTVTQQLEVAKARNQALEREIESIRQGQTGSEQDDLQREVERLQRENGDLQTKVQ